LADHYGIGTFPVYNIGDNVYFKDGQRFRYPFGGVPPDPALVQDLAQVGAKLNAMAREVPLDAPWLAANAPDWDGQTFQTWRDQHFQTEGARQFFDGVLHAIWGFEAREASLLYVLFYIAAAGNESTPGTLERLLGDAQQSRLIGGTQGLALRIAQDLGQAVVLSTPVRRITYDAAGVQVDGDRMSVSAKAVIVAIPTPLAGSSMTRRYPSCAINSPSACPSGRTSRPRRSTIVRSGATTGSLGRPSQPKVPSGPRSKARRRAVLAF